VTHTTWPVAGDSSSTPRCARGPLIARFASEPCEQATRASPCAAEALYATGHWLYSQRRIGHAIVVFRALVHVAPQDERGWLALGACHEGQDQNDLALGLYTAAVVEAHPAPQCELARARLLRACGMLGEATRP
jgi:hypothetical protein